MKFTVIRLVPPLLALGAVAGCDGAAAGERISGVESSVPPVQSFSEKSAPHVLSTVPKLLLPRIAAVAEGAPLSSRGPSASLSIRELDSTRARLMNDLGTITLPSHHPISLLLKERRLNTLPRLARELGVTLRFDESTGADSHAYASYVMTYKEQDVMRGAAARRFATPSVATLDDPRPGTRWLRPASLGQVDPEIVYPEADPDPNHPYWGSPATDEERMAAAMTLGAMVAELETIVAQLEADDGSSGLVGMTGACGAARTYFASSSGPNCQVLKYAAIGAAFTAIGFGLTAIGAVAAPEPMSKFAVAGLLTTAVGAVVGTMAAISAYNECKQGPTNNNHHPAALGTAQRGAMAAPFVATGVFGGREWVGA